MSIISSLFAFYLITHKKNRRERNDKKQTNGTRLFPFPLPKIVFPFLPPTPRPHPTPGPFFPSNFLRLCTLIFWKWKKGEESTHDIKKNYSRHRQKALEADMTQEEEFKEGRSYRDDDARIMYYGTTEEEGGGGGEI